MARGARAKRGNATVMLKGEASIVADPSGAVYVIPTGNPGLATPGTGDVLSGVIVVSSPRACRPPRRPVWAGSSTGWRQTLPSTAVGTEGMVAGDLLKFLPQAVEGSSSTANEDDDEAHGPRTRQGAADERRRTGAGRAARLRHHDGEAVTIGPQATVQELADLLRARNQRRAGRRRSSQAVGVVTERRHGGAGR